MATEKTAVAGPIQVGLPVWYLILAILIMGAAYGARWHWMQQPVDHAQVSFLDVGQGDAIYIRTESGMDILIDGGPDDSVVRRLGDVMPFWDRTLELVVLSHPHADHVAGLVNILQYYEVSQVAIVDLEINSAVYQAFADQVAKQQSIIVEPLAGDVITLGDHEWFNVLHPFVDEDVENLDLNSTSIVFEYVYSGQQETRILLTGDMEEDIEKQLVENQILRDIDILKVGHHGSNTSSTVDFLNSVTPEISVIQVGEDNKFGHPRAEVLERLYSYGEVLRTDELGTITFYINGDGYEIAP